MKRALVGLLSAVIAGVAVLSFATPSYAEVRPQTLKGDFVAQELFRQPISEPFIVTMRTRVLTVDESMPFAMAFRPIGKDYASGPAWVPTVPEDAVRNGRWSAISYQEVGSLSSIYSRSNPVAGVYVHGYGPWEIKIEPLSAAPIRQVPGGKGRNGFVAQFPSPLTRERTFSFTNKGQGAFIVRPIMESGLVGPTLVNGTNVRTAKGVAPKGTAYLWITSNGQWTYRS